MASGTFPILEAVGSRRRLDVAALDRPAVFVCYAEATQDGAAAIEDAVRQRHAASDVLVAHVIDLHTVPRIFHSVARNILDAEYEKAVAALPPGETAADFVVILPDWDGAFVSALGLDDVSKRLGVAVFASDGGLLGTQQDGDIAASALRLLADASR